MYLYSEEGVERPTVSTTLSKLANYDTVPLAAEGEVGSNGEVNPNAKPAQKANLGTITGIYLPCLQNIFGVILFIRMVWFVGTAGIPVAFVIVFICCSVTFTTAISLSAIATNGIVPAGGSYFMISRSLGPEFGGAVGILFFLATSVAGAMYITGAVEILLNYISPAMALFGDFRTDSSILYHNIRFYGTLLLILSCVFVYAGVRFVSKVAPIALVCVILSILSIYSGIFINFEGTPDTFCMLGERILSNNGSMDCSKNVSNPYSYWYTFCDWQERNESTYSYNPRYSAAGDNPTYNFNPLRPGSSGQWVCDPYFMSKDLHIERAVPGIASGIIKQNLPTRFGVKGDLVSLEEDPSYDSSKPKHSNIFIDITTSFTFFVAVYFPSCTGILAGSNRSGDLKDPQGSIPIGTIAAQLTTSFVYLSSVILFGASFNNLFVRDKFGECANGQLAVTLIAWPFPFLIVIGALLSTMGAALQSITSAPRLLQAIAKDDIIPFLKPFKQMDNRGEPVRALAATIVIAWGAILIGNLDFIAPILTMFFLMCYMFVNLACTLQSVLKTPNWRPRFKYYHWSLSLIGVFLCLFVMFISSWVYAIMAMTIAGCIYKYIEYSGAEKEWGDGIDGLQLSAARYSLLRLEDGPTHTKNWRPQIMVLCKMKRDHTVKHRKILSFAAQLKAGKGLTVVSTCIEGAFNTHTFHEKEQVRKALHRQMNEEKVKGFCSVLITKSVSEGVSHLVQTAGLGGLRHNCVIIGWPSNWKQDAHRVVQFLSIIRTVTVNRNALLIPKGVDAWPESGDKMGGVIDVWWIVHDGGLLMLLPFLLRQHKTWKNCQLRIFTVAQLCDNSVQMKKDLQQWIYALRIDAKVVEVIELNDQDISEYTYERTIRMEQRTETLRQLYFRNTNQVPTVSSIATDNSQSLKGKDRFNSQDNSVDETLDEEDDLSASLDEKYPLNASSRSKDQSNSSQPAQENQSAQDSPAKSSLNDEPSSESSAPPPPPKFSVQAATPQQSPKSDLDRSTNDGRASASPSSKMFSLRPDESNVKRMNTAVKLNEAILSKSASSKLVILNLPGLPKNTESDVSCHHYMEFLDVLCEGLERVLLVRGGGREVITIYS